MKVLITETQSDIIRLRRYYRQVQDEFAERSFRYNPCDYNYEDGVNDYYSDVESTVVDSMVSKEGWSWDDDFNKIDELYNTTAKLLYPIAFPILKSYYDDIIEAGCEDY